MAGKRAAKEETGTGDTAGVRATERGQPEPAALANGPGKSAELAGVEDGAAVNSESAGVDDGPSTGAHEVLGVQFTTRRVVGAFLFVVLSIAFLYIVLPKLVGLKDTWSRLQQGNLWWLGLAVVLECLSFASYIALFRVVFIRESSRITWRVSYQITMAGVAATRLLASAGAGGVVVTAWALTRSGMRARLVATRMTAFLVLLYAVYMATLVIDGVLLYVGVFTKPQPFAITMVPAIFGAVVIVVFLAASAQPWDVEAAVRRWTNAESRMGRLARSISKAPAAISEGVRDAIGLVRTRDPMLLGAVGWWGFDIAVLWACFHAFGTAPPKAVIVMAYFVGMLGNVLPLPGGIGGVDGGMIGAFTAFGVNVELAIVSVLAYRAFAFWIPTIPGAIAFLQLRRTVHRWREGEQIHGPAEAPAMARSYT